MGQLSGKRRWLICGAVGIIILALVAIVPVGGGDLRSVSGSQLRVKTMDYSAFSAAPPERPLDLLFIHHSVGGQWLADVGPGIGEDCINVSHPEGGGLRTRLEQAGYVIHEASYGSEVGAKTDLFDWLPKFRDHMAQVLGCARQDTVLVPPARNCIVMFKSCYYNNGFEGPGQSPGNPQGPELTLANARAAYTALLPEMGKQPGVLFVCVTTPPLAPRYKPEPLWKSAARKVLGKMDLRQKLIMRGRLSREFANWLKADDGWLKDYPQRNVVVFDYYDILTGHGASDLLKYPTDEGFNSHPSAEGQRLAAEAFVPFLNRVVRFAGLVK
jgi:hypothetical protein